VVCFALGLSVAPAHAAVSVVTTASGDQTAPRICGSKVVYTNNPSGHLAYPDTDDREVWLFDVGTKVSKRLATGVHSLAADLNSTTVVYVRDIGGVHWLASCDIATSKETTLVVVPQGLLACSNDPRISGNRVVWQQIDLAGSGVEMFDLGTKARTEIATPTAGAPAISGDSVVWEDWRDRENDVFLCDLSTYATRRLTDSPEHRLAASISGTRVLWQVSDSVWDPWAISSFDLVGGTESSLDAMHAHTPFISGDIAVWGRVRNVGDPSDFGSDLYRYDFSSHTERRLTDSALKKIPGGVDADRFVWTQQDTDGSGWNVYSMLSLPTATSVSVRATTRAPTLDASFEITGTLDGGGSGLKLVCERTGAGPATWSKVGTATTTTGGQFRFSSKCVARATYRFRFQGTDTLGPSESPLIAVRPAALIRRIGGIDRYATAVAISKASYPTTAAAVVVATGVNFPDALAATTLARAYRGPVLLTTFASLPTTVSAELRRLAPKRVFVVGGEGVVSKAVYDQLSRLPSRPTMKRLGGADRYDTSALIARQAWAAIGPVAKVVLTTGGDFGDALAVAPIAGAHGWPMMLTRPTGLPASVSSAIKDMKPTTSLVIGSTGSVSDTVKKALPLAERVYGSNRGATSVAVATWAASKGLPVDRLALATDAKFPDGLAAGPFLAMNGGMLLLIPTDSARMPSSASAFVSGHRGTVLRVELLGQSGAVSDGYVTKMGQLLAP
jgi:beta propeller repeat protein